MPKQKRLVPPPTETPSWDVIQWLRGSKLDELVDTYIEIGIEIQKLKKQQDDLKVAGIEKLIKARVKSVLVGHHKVTRVDGVSTHISKKGLFRLGVSQKI